MSDYGVFEASSTDGHEEEQRQRQATRDLGRAIESAREGFGDFLGAATDKQDYQDRLALVMNDLMQKVADSGVMPVPGVMRKVKAALRPQFRKAANEEALEWAENYYQRNKTGDGVDTWRDALGLAGDEFGTNFSAEDYARHSSRKQAALRTAAGLDEFENMLRANWGASFNEFLNEFDEESQRDARDEFKNTFGVTDADLNGFLPSIGASRKQSRTEDEIRKARDDLDKDLTDALDEGGRGDEVKELRQKLRDIDDELSDSMRESSRKTAYNDGEAAEAAAAWAESLGYNDPWGFASWLVGKGYLYPMSDSEYQQYLQEFQAEDDPGVYGSSKQASDIPWFSNHDGSDEVRFSNGSYMLINPDGSWQVGDGTFMTTGQESSVERAKEVATEQLFFFGSKIAKRKQANNYEEIADRAADDFERETGNDPYTDPSFITQYLPAWASANAQNIAFDPALYEELEMEANMLGYGYTVEGKRKQADADTDARWFFQNLKGRGYTLPKDAGYPGDGGQFDEYLDDFARRDGLDAEALRSFLSDNWDEYSVGHPKDVARERLLGGSRKIGSEADSVEAVVDFLIFCDKEGFSEESHDSLDIYNGNDEISQDDYNTIYDFISGDLDDHIYPKVHDRVRQRSSSRKRASDFNTEDRDVLQFFYQFEDEGLDASASGDEQWEWLKSNIDYDTLQDAIDQAHEYGEMSASQADSMAYDLQQNFFGSRKQASAYLPVVSVEQDTGDSYMAELRGGFAFEAYDEGGTWVWNIFDNSGEEVASDETFSLDAAKDDAAYALERVASRKTATPKDILIFDSLSELLLNGGLSPEDEDAIERAYQQAEQGKWQAAYNSVTFVADGPDLSAGADRLVESILDDIESLVGDPSRKVDSRRKQAGGGNWEQSYDGSDEWKLTGNPQVVIMSEDDGFYLFNGVELVEVTDTLEQAMDLGESSHVAGRKQALELGEWEEDLPGLGYAKATKTPGGGWEVYIWDEAGQNETLTPVNSSEEARRLFYDVIKSYPGSGFDHIDF